MPHYVKRHDQVELRWQLSADVSGATEVRVLASTTQDDSGLVVDRVASVDPDDPTVVVLTVLSSETVLPVRLYVEIQTTWADGQVVTFPERGYERLVIASDLGPE